MQCMASFSPDTVGHFHPPADSLVVQDCSDIVKVQFPVLSDRAKFPQCNNISHGDDKV